MDMTTFQELRLIHARARAALLTRYVRENRQMGGADYVPARAKAWWIP